MIGKNRFVAGGNEPALSFDPLKGGPSSPPISPRNGRVYVSPDTQVTGRTELNGRKINSEQLVKLQTPPTRMSRNKTPFQRK